MQRVLQLAKFELGVGKSSHIWKGSVNLFAGARRTLLQEAVVEHDVCDGIGVLRPICKCAISKEKALGHNMNLEDC